MVGFEFLTYTPVILHYEKPRNLVANRNWTLPMLA